MAHIFSYPNASSPSAQITLHPALVRIDDEADIQPVQRYIEAPDGTQWVFQLSTNRRLGFEVIVSNLPEADFTIAAQLFHGYSSLKTFFDSNTNWMQQQFECGHTDGVVTPVRVVLASWSFREGRRARWDGTFQLRKAF